jgi:hypothetical protein
MVVASLCSLAGITVGQQVLCQPELEFYCLENFYDRTRPGGVEVWRTRQGIDWILKNPVRLFPETSAITATWYSPKWALHKKFAVSTRSKIFIVGRRLIDGNMVGKDGVQVSKSGLVTLNPIFDWDHEMVFAYLYYRDLEPPPYFNWPLGFKYGNEPWGNRRWSDNIECNWNIVTEIQPDLVHFKSFFSNDIVKCRANEGF